MPLLFGLLPLPATAQPPDQSAPNLPRPPSAARPQPPPVILFYSPAPPVMGAADGSGGSIFATGPSAPAAMADYVNEPFYAPLAARLLRNDLGADIALRLDRYKVEKSALLQELRARLDILRESDPAIRERELRAFALEQTPRIAALEATAEAIRFALCDNAESSTDYFRWVLAHSGVTDRPEKRVLLSSLKAEVYYREGLSPGQRRLLRAFIMDLTDSLDGRSAPKERSFRFSPETSTIVVRDDLPKDVYASLVAYRDGKSSLEKAILRALYPKVDDPNDVHGIELLGTLASVQAPQIAALEEQAEDIRRRLAALGDSDRQPEMAAIPAELQARVAAYRSEKLALQKALLARVEEVKKNRGFADSAADSESIRQAIAAFTGENADRYAALGKMRDSIRTDLSKLEAGSSAPVSPDAMLAQFSDSLKKLQSYWDYHDYRNAVLQPGLSPEQRRLLFDGALQKLALPLPRGELLFEPE